MAATVQEALERHCPGTIPDAVFLDIQLTGRNRFRRSGGSSEQAPGSVRNGLWTTFALRAFEVNALDYLLKPIDRSRLDEAVNRLLSGQGLLLLRATE